MNAACWIGCNTPLAIRPIQNSACNAVFDRKTSLLVTTGRSVKLKLKREPMLQTCAGKPCLVKSSLGSRCGYGLIRLSSSITAVPRPSPAGFRKTCQSGRSACDQRCHQWCHHLVEDQENSRTKSLLSQHLKESFINHDGTTGRRGYGLENHDHQLVSMPIETQASVWLYGSITVGIPAKPNAESGMNPNGIPG